MMCARRVCGCALRGNLVRLTAAGVAVVALAGTTVMEDVLNAILIASSALTAWIVAFFTVQVYRSRRPATRHRHTSRAAAAQPAAQPVTPSWMAGGVPQRAAETPQRAHTPLMPETPQMAAEALRAVPAGVLVGERDAARG